MDREADIIVVGAGPAGLHAALKAAVLNHTVLLVDKGRRFSRVSQAPAIANIPLHPGISGAQLLEEGRRDLARFRDLSGKALVQLEEEADVVLLTRLGDAWGVRVEQRGRTWTAHAPVVILATGVVDQKPGIDAFDERGHETLAPYLHGGKVGYCLLCEGWALAGRRVAVVGSSADAAQIAADVCEQFEGSVTLLTDGHEPERAPPEGVRVETRRIVGARQEGDEVVMDLEGGAAARFDKALLGLGWHRVNSALAQAAGAATTREGYVLTDAGCEVRSSDGGALRGLFAIGDVRAGPWKQIPLAWADAELAVISAYAHRLPAKAAATGAARRP